jgi:hypothetical protein
VFSIKPDDVKDALIDVSDHRAFAEKSDSRKILIFGDVRWDTDFYSEPGNFFASRPVTASLHNLQPSSLADLQEGASERGPFFLAAIRNAESGDGVLERKFGMPTTPIRCLNLRGKTNVLTLSPLVAVQSHRRSAEF